MYMVQATICMYQIDNFSPNDLYKIHIMHKQNTGIISLIPNVKSRKVYMKFERFDLHYPSCFMALRLTTVNCVHVGARQVMVRSLDDFTLTRYPLYCNEHLFQTSKISCIPSSNSRVSRPAQNFTGFSLDYSMFSRTFLRCSTNLGNFLRKKICVAILSKANFSQTCKFEVNF